MKTQITFAGILLILSTVLIVPTVSAQKISTGGIHSMAICTDHTVRDWGHNGYGELGTGNTTESHSPVQVNGISGAIAVSGGAFHSLILKDDGTVWSYGNNSSGTLGDSTVATKTSAVKVKKLSGVIAISGGYGHSLALKSDSTVWAWGFNASGALGDSTTDVTGCLCKTVPVRVTNLSGVIAISAGRYHSLALKSDGTVWAWGGNNKGQLGDGTTSATGCYCKNSPVKVSNLTGVIAIAAGDYFSLAVKSDGSVWAWGVNDFGQLGNGTHTDSNVPVQIGGISDVKAVSGAIYHCLALKKDGTVWAWGRNNFGQLGDSSNTDSYIPVKVAGLSDITAISSANAQSLALKNDGSLWAWGINDYGELGDGSIINKSKAIQVSSLCQVATSANELPLPLNEIELFPNPTPGIFNLSFSAEISGETKAHFEIYNFLGKMIGSSVISDRTTTINISSQPSGIYFVKVYTHAGIITEKIIRQD